MPSVSRYTDTLVDMMLLRRLQPYHVNVGKRLIKSPIVYPGTDTYPLGDGITAIPLPALMERLLAQG